MGRVIKFRAWHTGGQYPEEAQMLYVGDSLGTRHPLDCCNYLIQGQPVTLMQFTGLTDKNGVEIYEGDVVEYPHSNKSKGKVRSEVIFDQCGFTVAVNNSIFHDDAVLMACVVIGNIYQNPELLK